MTPVVRNFPLRCESGYAFQVFTGHIGQWWPKGFTASGDKLAHVAIENGRVYERDSDGNEVDWGSVVNWEPGHRLVLLWTLGLQRGTTSQVEVRFSNSELRLEHGNWDADQAGDRAKFDDAQGWDVVLTAFRRYAEVHPA